MYKIVYVSSENYVFVDSDDKNEFPKGYMTDRLFNIVSPKIEVDRVLKFNPYVEDPSEEDAVKRYKPKNDKMVEVVAKSNKV